MEPSDAELIAAVLRGDASSFEPLVQKYSPRVFATARRYARRESEVEDIVQEVWLKAFHKLASFRGDAPFEHWLMRLAVRTCYDFLRGHQRNRESSFTDLTEPSAFPEELGARIVLSELRSYRDAGAPTSIERVTFVALDDDRRDIWRDAWTLLDAVYAEHARESQAAPAPAAEDPFAAGCVAFERTPAR